MFIQAMEGLRMDMSIGTSSAFYSGAKHQSNSNQFNNNKQVNPEYARFFADANKRNEKSVEKPGRTASYTVTSYTDKEGNVHRTFTGTTTDVVETMKKANEKANEDDKYKIKKHLQYSYQRVSNQVTMAKNSMSAARAVISATRNLADLKNKLRDAECSEDEKAAALAHANQMLRIAKKKKNNLEMEEMVKSNLGEDGAGGSSTEFIKDEKPERKMFDISQLYEDSEGNPDAEYDYLIMDEQTDGMDADFSDEMASELEELADLTQDMNEELNEVLEEDMLDLMEVVNPHMDKEHYEELKTKHRLDEQKMIVKADTEYLKAYLKAVQGDAVAGAYSSSMNTQDMSMFADMSMGISMLAGMEVTDTSLGFNVSV